MIAKSSAGPRVFTAENTSLNPEFFFEIDPLLFVQIEDLGFKVIAIAHSHPDGKAIPSPADSDGWFFTDAQKRRTPRFPEVLYIVAVLNGGQVNATVFCARSGLLVEVDQLFAGQPESP